MTAARRRTWVVVLAVAALAALPYLTDGGLRTFVFVDDALNVLENEHVLPGLTAAGARWAFTEFHGANWHPLTWLSHMADVSLFGLEARGHHLTSLTLHALAAGLLFLALFRLTGALWRSALAAALFGSHPLRVESVAWIAERKDVLSGVFFMLVLLAWERYARRRGAGRYALVALLLALGLMAKPMLVTAPFVLLLLDLWPLGRWRPGQSASRLGALVAEKLPLLLLSLASGVVTFLAQRAGEAVQGLEAYTLSVRLSNALVSCVAYLGMTLWPARLAFHYPHPVVVVAGKAAAALAVLGLLTWVAWRVRRRAPWWGTGWLWFLGMLVPVIGIVQVGEQAMADRYTYLPGIGLAVALVWGAAGAARGRGVRPAAVATLAGAVLGALLVASALQAGRWRDAETLFRHTLAVTEGNWMTHNNLAVLLAREKRREEALRHYREGLLIQPYYADGHYNLGLLLAELGRTAEAIGEFREATRLDPRHAKALAHLGIALGRLGRWEEAVARQREALRVQPDFPEARNSLGLALVELGLPAEAEAEYREALRLRDEYPEARHNLALLLTRLGRVGEAADNYREALRLRPDLAESHQNLGVLLAREGRQGEAVAHFQEAVRLRPDYPEALFNLGLTHFLAGRMAEAEPPLREAVRLHPDFAEAREYLERALAAAGARDGTGAAAPKSGGEGAGRP